MNDSKHPRHEISRDAWLFIGYWAVIGLAVFGVESVIRSLYLIQIGFGAGKIGLLEGITGASSAIFGIPAGLWGKKTGNRKLAFLGAILLTTGIIGLPMAEMFEPGFRFTWLIAVFILRGIGPAMFVPNFTAYLSSTCRSDEGRQYVFSRLDAAFPAGKFIGAILGGSIPGLLAANVAVDFSMSDSYRTTLWIFAALAAVGLILIARTRDHNQGLEKNILDSRQSTAPFSKLWLFLLFMVVFSLLNTAAIYPVTLFFSLYMNTSLGVPPAQIGMTIGGGQLLGALAAFAMPELARRLGSVVTVILSLLGVVIGLTALAIFKTPIAASISGMIVLGLSTIIISSTTALHQRRSPEQWRSIVSSIWFSSSGIARMVVAAGSGAVITTYGFAPVFAVSSIAALCGAGVFAAMARVNIYQDSLCPE